MRISNLLMCFITGFVLSGIVNADEVKLSHNGLTLNANLQLSADKQLSDGVILFTHAGLAHYGMETATSMQNLLNERGYSTLAINLSLGLDDRHGMYDCKTTHKHLYTDAADEIGAWVNWLKKQGANQIILLGHSRGGAETALYAAEHDSPLIKSVVLLAPDTLETNDHAVYQRRYNKPLAPILNKATVLVKKGQGDSVLEHTDFLYCQDTSVTASTFVSYYGTDPRLDTAYLIPKISKRTLLVIAGDDEIVINNDKFKSLADENRVHLRAVDGAGHFLRDIFAEDAADIIAEFLDENG